MMFNLKPVELGFAKSSRSVLLAWKLVTTWIFVVLEENYIDRNYIYVSDFPGSKAVSEASSKFGPALVSGPVFFVFEKVSTFIVTEEKTEEAPKTEEETSGVKDREIVVEEGKKEEISESAAEKAEEKAKAANDTLPPPPEVTEKQEEKPVEPTAVETSAVEKVEPPKAWKIVDELKIMNMLYMCNSLHILSKNVT